MITYASDSSQRAHIERACRKADFEPRITAETMRLTLLWELVSQGVGIAVIPPRPTQRRSGDADPDHSPRLHIRTVLASS